ncbi:WhiB family transcriptional regulator [Microbispora corallina]|uniref:Transcriptional regulator WhiB n=1 Tax=Microbispora corallina TaxID=83302 RepID=A0ABQ4GCK7_9ACTN|nr:WhiB family transcriptional regulator [Microbispora corallina]GIH44798.1 transcriptional regulator WhiB [Microbispora corallina]
MTADEMAELYALARDPATAWMDYAVCPETDGDVFFAEDDGRGTTPRARAICRGCPVIAECLQWALDHGELGVWGGTTETDRKRMKRKPKTAAVLELAA